MLDDILSIAMNVIGWKYFSYKKFKNKSTNSVGIDVTNYYTPVTIKGSVQAIPRSLYQEYGLDYQRHYLMFYVPKGTYDVARDVSGDQIVWDGQTYQCLSNTEWFPIYKFTGILAVQV